MLRTAQRLAAVVSLAALVAACGTLSGENNDVTVPPNAGVYKIGKPYQIGDTWYYPREQPDYDETGIASWYGPTFYGHRTANGEVYTAQDLTAAHRTLPLPVNVRVTNLDNGKSLVVRVNDRGPFAKGRIIDLSERAAELLGYKEKGTARVRVTFVGRADRPRRRRRTRHRAGRRRGAAGSGRQPAGSTADRQRRRRRRHPAHRHRQRSSGSARDAALCPGRRLQFLPECRTAAVAPWRRPRDRLQHAGRPYHLPRPLRPVRRCGRRG